MRHCTIPHDLGRHAGVYSITNTINNRVYIGGTCRSFHGRWSRHVHDLTTGIHVNAELQNDWTKYGQSSFAFNVIVIVGSDNLRTCEQETMDRYLSSGISLYNEKRSYIEPMDEYTEDELFASLYHRLPEPIDA